MWPVVVFVTNRWDPREENSKCAAYGEIGTLAWRWYFATNTAQFSCSLSWCDVSEDIFVLIRGPKLAVLQKDEHADKDPAKTWDVRVELVLYWKVDFHHDGRIATSANVSGKRSRSIMGHTSVVEKSFLGVKKRALDTLSLNVQSKLHNK